MLGHDSAVVADERVQEARLPDVGTADHGDADSFLRAARARKSRQALVDLPDDGGTRRGHRGRVHRLSHLHRKIDARLHFGQERDELPTPRFHGARQRSAESERRRLGRALGAGAHERGDRFRLREIELSVPVGALGEFARTRGTRAVQDQCVEDSARNRGAAVRGNLRHVLAGVGMGRSEDGDENGVEGSAIVPEEGPEEDPVGGASERRAASAKSRGDQLESARSTHARDGDG
jgi:hypothetical protein